MKNTNLIFLLFICLVACNNAYDAEKIAERYCDCMRDNGSPDNFEKASVICGNKLTAENRYMKLWAVDMNDRELDKKVLNETRDSVKLFIDSFLSYTNTHCYKETLACPDSTELK